MTTAEAHGLREDEYALICKLLDREPNFTELGVFSLMWSEHCGYKFSRARLAELPTTGPHVLQGPGENAGAVDVGDGLAVVFKMESHNHPSAVEPYQGAATGVGGILRDIFTMGARPIALLDSLRFGELDDPHVRYLFRNVVRGGGDYGNCVGVPTVGGEVVFDDAYRGNPLVNAMCVGLLRHEEMMRASAGEPGSAVYVLGAATGRDGIHGASRLASTELSDDSAENRPTVQVGDPFSGKLLLEATLELIGAGVVLGIQDMGAAGLTSSSSEMASRSGAGIVIDIDRVPRREPGMDAYEVLLSESQERMLLVADDAHEKELMSIAARWDLPCTRVGTVTGDGIWRVTEHGSEVCAIPVSALTDDVPRYIRKVDPPAYIAELHAWSPPEGWLDGVDPMLALEVLLGAPSIASKRWVWQQYDHHVRTSTVMGPGCEAAVLRLRGTRRGLALTVDGNGRYVYCDPRRGAAMAVAEAARNLAAVGARPLAITDCLNFGNPEKDAVYWQFAEAIAGLSEAARAFDTPVVSGNVSFYNESPAGAIYPTPTVGMVGVLDDIALRIPPDRGAAGDSLILAGREGSHLGASAFLKEVCREVEGRAPETDLAAERAAGDAVRALNGAGLLETTRDLSDGGLAVAAVELLLSFPSPAGVELTIPPDAAPCPALFGEDGARFLLVVRPTNEPGTLDILTEHSVPARRCGRLIQEDVFRVAGVGERSRSSLAALYEGAIPDLMEQAEPNR